MRNGSAVDFERLRVHLDLSKHTRLKLEPIIQERGYSTGLISAIRLNSHTSTKTRVH